MPEREDTHIGKVIEYIETGVYRGDIKGTSQKIQEHYIV